VFIYNSEKGTRRTLYDDLLQYDVMHNMIYGCPYYVCRGKEGNCAKSVMLEDRGNCNVFSPFLSKWRGLYVEQMYIGSSSEV